MGLFLLASAAAACSGSEATEGSGDALDPDGETSAESDAGPDAPRDGGGSDAPDDGAGPGDPEVGGPADVGARPDVGAPDAAPEDLPDRVPSRCDVDADCRLSCAPDGRCDKGACVYEAARAGCVVEASGEQACRPSGAVDPTTGCLACRPGISSTGWTGRLVEADFDDGVGPFTDVRLEGTPGATWTWSDARAAEGGGSLYFGDPAQGSYDVGGRASALVLGPVVEVPPDASPELGFLVWMDTEGSVAYDFLRVLAVDPDEETRTELWHSDAIGGTTGGTFRPVRVPVDVEGADRIRLAFEFDSVDGVANAFEGVYVDRIRLRSGCCADSRDCDDSDPCTADACAGGACRHAAVEGCCNTDATCGEEAELCMEASCSGLGGTCEEEPVEDCCTTASECDDGDPCTEDICPEAGEACLHIPLCCRGDSDCDDGDPCTEGACLEGQCVFDFTCCVDDAGCDDGDACTRNRCVDGACESEPLHLPGCCTPDVLIEDFDQGDPLGWSFPVPNAGVGWHVIETSLATSPPGVLYYGNPAAMNFDSGTANKGVATSAAIVLPPDMELQLQLRALIDTEAGASYDQLFVYAVTEAGEEITLFDKTALEQEEWTAVEADLSYLQGRTIRLRFEFNTVDSSLNQGLGVMIDDLTIVTSCEAKRCTQDGGCESAFGCVSGRCDKGRCVWRDDCCTTVDECDDGDVCTLDACDDGLCTHEPIEGCCESADDCDDGDPCTVDTCSGVGGSCSSKAIEGCCLSSADCDDGDPCTVDLCVGTVCQHEEVCCESAEDCDDGDDVCTEDLCVDGLCSYLPTGVEGCCEETPVAWTFETPLDFSFVATSPPCSWQIITTPEAVSGTRALYYGNVGAGDYDCGHNGGVATGPVITLPEDAAYELRFELYFGAVTLFEWDRLHIRATEVSGAFDVPLWTKQSLGSGKWNAYKVDVSPLAGESFQLRFAFDTVDDSTGDGPGLFLDDVRIVSSCEPVACEGDGDCASPLAGADGVCGPAGCEWTME